MCVAPACPFLASKVLYLQSFCARWGGHRVSSLWNREHPTGQDTSAVGAPAARQQGAKKPWLQWDLNTMVLGTVLAFDMVCCLFSLYRNSPELSLPCQAVRHCQKAPSLWLPTNSSRRLSDTERRIMNRFGIDKLPKHCPLCLKSH